MLESWKQGGREKKRIEPRSKQQAKNEQCLQCLTESMLTPAKMPSKVGDLSMTGILPCTSMTTTRWVQTKKYTGTQSTLKRQQTHVNRSCGVSCRQQLIVDAVGRRTASMVQHRFCRDSSAGTKQVLRTRTDQLAGCFFFSCLNPRPLRLRSPESNSPTSDCMLSQ